MDGIVEGDWGSWALEVKSSRFDSRDLTGDDRVTLIVERGHGTI